MVVDDLKTSLSTSLESLLGNVEPIFLSLIGLARLPNPVSHFSQRVKEEE